MHPISALQRLRSVRLLGTRLIAWVLLGFVGSLGVAVASTVVNPQAMEWVCSVGGGMKLVVHGDEGDATSTTRTLDCPLCHLNAAPPPLAARVHQTQPQPLGVVMQPIEAARIARLTAPPLPSRGPPDVS